MKKEHNSPFDDSPFDDLGIEENSPFDDFDDEDDWIGYDSSETAAAENVEDFESTPQTHTKQIINADEDGDEDDLGVEAFDDFTPRKARFTAPRAEDVMVDDARPLHLAGDTNDPPLSAKEQKRADRVARKQRKADEKRERQQKKADAKRGQQTDDSTVTEFAEEADTVAVKKNLGRSTKVILSGMAVAVLGIAGIAGYYASQSDGEEAVDSSAQDATPTADAAAEDTNVVASQEKPLSDDQIDQAISAACEDAGATVESGNKGSPQAAIHGFNHAYFADRNAEAAAAFLDDRMYDTVESLQEGIDDPSNGDRYCVKIEPGDGENVFNVELIEFVLPGANENKIESWRTKQTVTVEDTGTVGWEIVNQAINPA